MSPIIRCADCQEEKEHYAHGVCKQCYMKQRIASPEGKKRHADNVRAWRKNNPEKAKAIEDRRENTERRQAWSAKYGRKYYAEHAEELREYQRQWRRDNTKKGTEYKRRFIERRRNLPDTLTETEWKEILEEHHYLCAYCESSIEQLFEEHWIPSSRGGGRTKENIVPACHRCNSRKGDMTGNEFLDVLDVEEWDIITSLVRRYNGACIDDTIV